MAQDSGYGIGPGEPISDQTRDKAMKAPLFALGGRDWFYTALGALGLFGLQKVKEMMDEREEE